MKGSRVLFVDRDQVCHILFPIAVEIARYHDGWLIREYAHDLGRVGPQVDGALHSKGTITHAGQEGHDSGFAVTSSQVDAAIAVEIKGCEGVRVAGHNKTQLG